MRLLNILLYAKYLDNNAFGICNDINTAIIDSPHSKLCQLESVEARNINNPAGSTLLNLEKKAAKSKIFFKLLAEIEKQSNGGILFTENQIKLIPVLPQVEYLKHVGLLSNRGENAIQNLLKTGVYGGAENTTPTYLSKIDAHPLTYESMMTSSPRITIFIDCKELLQLRSVFIDPETINSYMPFDQLGDSYFTVAGIPKEAIYSYSIDL